jgi:oligopeptidase B
VLYEVEHREGKFYIATNDGGLMNFKLCVVDAKPDCHNEWQPVTDSSGNVIFDGGADRCLEDITPFSNNLVCVGREGGIPRIWNISFNDKTGHVVTTCERFEFDEEAYDVCGTGNLEYDSDHYVVAYDSLVTPPSSIRVNLADQSVRQVVKQTNIPNYDASLYETTRGTVLSRDGVTQIPISTVYRKDLKKNVGEAQHLHLYGYGSYGACMEAYFSTSRLPLLNRGIVYVIAHVRGGGEMGRQWYEEPHGAKYLCKKNTFHDFVDCARNLIDSGATSPDKLSCEGRSAGGLLIGGSVNQAPELFKAAIFGVPFVDVVPTMADHTIPLTVVEWEEWGNPNETEFFQYMLDYSPINNVLPGGKYPSCLLTGGLHDPRVQYWEPAKLAAEMRHHSGEGSGRICLKIDMEAGHFSASDRYKYKRELSFDWAFILMEVGLA